MLPGVTPDESFSYESRPNESPGWTFVSNHFLVLFCIAGNPDMRVRDIAKLVGITERATQAILSDLDGEGYVKRTRIGRRNHYSVIRNQTLRHPLFGSIPVGELLGALTPGVGHVAHHRLAF